MQSQWDNCITLSGVICDENWFFKAKCITDVKPISVLPIVDTVFTLRVYHSSKTEEIKLYCIQRKVERKIESVELVNFYTSIL